ncbi:hypothetical protein Q6346_07470 [Isoptericola sp. b490]|uniref:hypothetical protein n=1 Tax=Actinotalea lenta TaxID=3064654 RepID=UPI002713C2E8|nr:hypothetical protein [Isoptericola sp. b490]MDO8121151.1 hypothetical protein [Isoptericola sp. b490]
MDAKPEERAQAPGEDARRAAERAPDAEQIGTSQAAEDESGETEEKVLSAEMMHLLHEGIPLALLADLASPGGPHSPDILEDEGLPDVEWWGPHDGGVGPSEQTEEPLAGEES